MFNFLSTINAEGDMVGGFLLSRRNFSTIDFPGAITSFARAIDPEGEIVGGYQSADGIYHGFLLSNGGAGGESAALVAPSQTSESPRATLPRKCSQAALAAMALRPTQTWAAGTGMTVPEDGNRGLSPALLSGEDFRQGFERRSQSAGAHAS
jgi:hypothetical protein